MMFFQQKIVGLDIDDRSVEVAEVKRQGKKIKILSLGRTVLEKGIVDKGRILQLGPLVSAIKETLAKAKPGSISNNKIILGLPTSQIYTATVKLPAEGVSNIDTALHAEARNVLPLEEDDLVLLSSKLSNNQINNVSEYLLIGASKQVIKEWQELVNKLKSNIKLLDLELYGMFRDLAVTDANKPVCLVDLGAVTTNIVVFHNDLIQYSCGLSLAGDQFTEAIANKFELDYNLAEVKKIRLGLNAQLHPILLPILEEITAEIKRVLDYYEEKTGNKVNEVVLVGGTSRLKGLLYYFRDTLGLPVNFGQSASAPGDYPEYIGAIGFAVKALFKDRWQSEPIIDFKNLANMKWINNAQDDIKARPVKLDKKIKLEEAKADDFGPVITTKNMPPDYEAKLAFEKKFLIAILVFGAVAITGAFWYRNGERTKRMPTYTVKSPDAGIQTQTFNYKVPIYLVSGSYGGATGHIVLDNSQTSTEYSEAKILSSRKIAASLGVGESYWPEPINDVIDASKLKAPYSFSWLVYSAKETLRGAFNNVQTTYINEFTKNNVQLNLGNNFVSWTKDTLIKSDDASKVELAGTITLSVNKIIEISSTQNIASTTLATTTVATSSATINTIDNSKKEVTIGSTITVKQTETGWLKVRSGAGKTFAEVTKINPGETYKVLDKQKDWLKIELKDKVEGWVSSSYVE